MKGDITVNLPIDLTLSGLTVEEIGAIFLLFSLQHMDKAKKEEFENRPDVVAAGAKLVERGIVEFIDVGNGQKEMSIDLSKLEPNKTNFNILEEMPVEEFWRVIENADEDGNDSYVSPKMENSTMHHYEAFQVLKENQIKFDIYVCYRVINSDTYRKDRIKNCNSLEEAKAFAIADAQCP